MLCALVGPFRDRRVAPTVAHGGTMFGWRKKEHEPFFHTLHRRRFIVAVPMWFAASLFLLFLILFARDPNQEDMPWLYFSLGSLLIGLSFFLTYESIDNQIRREKNKIERE
ncbi:MAG: hypothetical protein KBA91_02870 [Candidatus Moranbacteria bacterium]|nr:hypothetical protein [Candidatus Moranbacteria bacterium]